MNKLMNFVLNKKTNAIIVDRLNGSSDIVQHQDFDEESLHFQA